MKLKKHILGIVIVFLFLFIIDINFVKADIASSYLTINSPTTTQYLNAGTLPWTSNSTKCNANTRFYSVPFTTTTGKVDISIDDPDYNWQVWLYEYDTEISTSG